MTLNQLRTTRHAGRNLVFDRLRESKRHLAALFGGQSYADIVRKFQAKIRRAKEAKTSQEKCGMRLNNASLGKPLCKQILEIDTEEKEAHLRMVERTKKLFRKELNFIYVILCSVRNLRSRDLHTKHPLPLSVVQKIRKDPFVRLEELTSRRPRPDLAFPRNHPRSQDETRHSGRVLRNMPSALIDIGSHRDSSPSGVSRVRSRISSIYAGQSKRRLPTDSGLLETWNDLISLPAPDQNPPTLAPKELKKWTRRQSRLGSCLASKHSREVCSGGANKRQLDMKKDVKKPIWSQLGEYQKEKMKVVVQLQQTHKTLKTKRINKMLNSVLSEIMTRNPLESNYIEYLKVKRKLANNAEKKLDLMATDAADVFLDKYKAFSYITPRLPFHSFVKTMNDIVQENSRARHQYKIAHQDGEPKWLEFLRFDVENILGIDEKLEEMLKLMFRVAASELPWYHTQKVKSIMEDEDILEKLCLLTMSLPFYEICLPETQMAFMWVLENFSPRGYNPEMFQWWLEHRKIPSWYPFDSLITLVDTMELDKRTDWDIVE